MGRAGSSGKPVTPEASGEKQNYRPNKTGTMGWILRNGGIYPSAETGFPRLDRGGATGMHQDRLLPPWWQQAIGLEMSYVWWLEVLIELLLGPYVLEPVERFPSRRVEWALPILQSGDSRARGHSIPDSPGQGRTTTAPDQPPLECQHALPRAMRQSKPVCRGSYWHCRADPTHSPRDGATTARLHPLRNWTRSATNPAHQLGWLCHLSERQSAAAAR